MLRLARFGAIALILASLLSASSARGQAPPLLDSWSTHGSTGLCRPLGMSFDQHGNLHVTDTCLEQIFVFSASGATLQSWPTPFGTQGIAVASDGRVIAAQPIAQDTSGSGVFVFSGGGALLDRWSVNGTGPGELLIPRGVAIDENDLVYVTESGNARVQVFTLDGAFVRQWGGRGSRPGQFSDPEGIALGPDGLVYVTDADNQTIQVFTRAGALVRWWGGTLGNGLGEFHGLRGIALDASGNVYIADTGNHRVQIFRRSGEFLAAWGTEGSQPGQFNNPFSIAVDGQNRIYVGDFNARIQIFSDVATPAERTTWGRLKLIYRVPGANPQQPR